MNPYIAFEMTRPRSRQSKRHETVSPTGRRPILSFLAVLGLTACGGGGALAPNGLPFADASSSVASPPLAQGESITGMMTGYRLSPMGTLIGGERGATLTRTGPDRLHLVANGIDLTMVTTAHPDYYAALSDETRELRFLPSPSDDVRIARMTLGTLMGTMPVGYLSPQDAIPTVGGAHYNGTFEIMANDNSGVLAPEEWGIGLLVDFGSGMIGGVIDADGTALDVETVAISGGSFATTLSDGAGTMGNIDGSFYGHDAAAIAGNVDVLRPGSSARGSYVVTHD